jgi:hypothetical protein
MDDPYIIEHPRDFKSLGRDTRQSKTKRKDEGKKKRKKEQTHSNKKK